MAGAALAVGCGGDDADGGGATTETVTQPATEPSGGTVTKADLAACLSKAGLELKPGSEPVTDSEGETKTREGLDIADTEYLGYVQWPSKRISDVYLAKDEPTGAKAETEAGTFIKAFGLDPAKYLRRSGAVVLTFDDPPPSEDEAKAVLDCAGGGGGAAPEVEPEPEPSGGAKIEKSVAEASARKESSRKLEGQPGGFTVAEGDWQVDCTGGESGGPWSCKVESGPCNGTAVVTPKPDGSRVTVAKVGCAAD